MFETGNHLLQLMGVREYFTCIVMFIDVLVRIYCHPRLVTLSNERSFFQSSDRWNMVFCDSTVFEILGIAVRC